MTEKRPFAAWSRLFVGLVALAGVLGLSACGGGSGAPNNPFSPLTLLPGVVNAYAGVPLTLTISGGSSPYRAFSSDPSVLPIAQTVTGGSIVLVPNIVDVDSEVDISVRDATGLTVVAEITVRPAPLVNSLTLKADGFPVLGCPNPGGSASATDALAQTFICAGQTGSVAVRLKNVVGGGLAGRQVRFDVVQGDFQLFTNGPGLPPTFALSYTVPTDQNGDAVARVRAMPNANQQIVIVQATDLLTGTFVRGIFIITNGDGLLVIPDAVSITGPDTETCSSGVVTSFFIFGGLPPYTISNTFPQFISVSTSVVNVSGAGFNASTLGGCVDPAIIAITDSAGHTTTVEITNELGSIPPATVTTPIPIVIAPTTVLPTLGCGATINVVATGGGTTSQQGSTTTITPAESYFVSVDRPDIVSVLPTTPAPGESIRLDRLPGSTVNPAAAAGSVQNVTLRVSDGAQVVTKNVPVINTCP